MSPKKGSKAATKPKTGKPEDFKEHEDVENGTTTPAQPDTQQKEDDNTTTTTATAQSNSSKKRKTTTSSSTTKPPPSKAPRTSRRRHASPASPSSPTSIIHFLLTSPSALPLCYPSDELSAPSSQTKYSSTPPQTFTPFTTLLTASLLSKPLSHRLGYRSIRTLLSPPYSLTSSRIVVDAGEHRVLQALEQARTQHRQKTAAYVFQMAVAIEEAGGEESWFKTVLKNAGAGDGSEGLGREIIKRVKGMGEIGAGVFLRRAQVLSSSSEWGERVWPYADGKALEAVRECGMDGIRDAEGLWEVVREVDVEGDLGLEGKVEEEGGDDEMARKKKKVAFVVVLERCLGAVLEGNADEIKAKAAAASSSSSK